MQYTVYDKNLNVQCNLLCKYVGTVIWFIFLILPVLNQAEKILYHFLYTFSCTFCRSSLTAVIQCLVHGKYITGWMCLLGMVIYIARCLHTGLLFRLKDAARETAKRAKELAQEKAGPIYAACEGVKSWE